MGVYHLSARDVSSLCALNRMSKSNVTSHYIKVSILLRGKKRFISAKELRCGELLTHRGIVRLLWWIKCDAWHSPGP